MTKRNLVKLYVTGAVVVVAILLLVVFRNNFFSNTKGKILDLLHLKGRVIVKGDSESINNSDLLKKYYDIFGYTQTWSDKAIENARYRDMLIQMLNYADSLGLDRKDYHSDYVVKYDSLSHLPVFEMGEFEPENELIYTDAAISFLYHVTYGKEIKRIEYNGVKYNIDSARILNMFNELLVHRDWRRTLDSIEPKTSQYFILKRELNRMTAIMKQGSFADPLIADTDEEGKQIALVKLKAYNLFPDTLNQDSITDENIKDAIISFQKMMSIDTTGKLDMKTVEALNFPLSKRIEQIKESLNYWRWTGRLQEQEFILVNIPAARLQIVNRDSVKDMSMRVIVGKSETQTPSFTAYITRVITYPYWTVPFGIAVDEMLPKIRKRLGYLEDNNLHVIDAKGKMIDPQTINWKKFSRKYFPYTIRQATGCDNALGLLKFDLNSPFSIYLHDTNRRDLFAKKDRFMSHGCVRVEKPLELAQFILEEGQDSTVSAKLDSCMKDQKPTEFRLKNKFPVLILYMTADVDENGKLKFYNDVYRIEEENS